MTGHILKALSTREMARGPFASPDSAAQAENWQHWHLDRDSNDVAWLIFDKKDAGANVISAGVLEELDKIVSELESKPPKGLVLRSTKSTGVLPRGRYL